jgi:Mn-dependent DtxR family transcriptional regulator
MEEFGVAIHESGEDYLETVLLLEKRNHIVRSVDVANEMGFSKPSSIYERHMAIAEFLEKNLGVSKETALKDACRIEHNLSQETWQIKIINEAQYKQPRMGFKPILGCLYWACEGLIS